MASYYFSCNFCENVQYYSFVVQKGLRQLLGTFKYTRDLHIHIHITSSKYMAGQVK